MTDEQVREVAILYVREQRAVAGRLVDELHRLGIAVFCDDFDNAERACRIVGRESHVGFERASLFVLLFSRQYRDRAWEQDDRGLILSEISNQESAAVRVLRLDDTPVPDGLGKVEDYRNADDHTWTRFARALGTELNRDGSKGGQPSRLTSLTGETIWSNYVHGGTLVIGRDNLTFETSWSKCGRDRIFVYNDEPTLAGVALADGYTSIEQIINARFLDYTGRFRRPRKTEIVVLRNMNGFYAAVQVLGVKDKDRGDGVDELHLRYVIQPDGSDDFGGGACVDSVQVTGFRSLQGTELNHLGSLVAMIGPNGCGKSNIIRLFEMMYRMLAFRRLASFVGEHGGGDDQLFKGSKETQYIEVKTTLRVGASDFYDYRFKLKYGNKDRLLFEDEAFRLRNDQQEKGDWESIDGSIGQVEAGLVTESHHPPGSATLRSRTAANIVHVLGGIRIYQFHDTSKNSGFNKPCDSQDYSDLKTDGSNLAAVLFYLKRAHPDCFELICNHVRRVLPGFDQFDLQEFQGKVNLGWTSENVDKSFGAHLTSDGSLRLFALVTLLNLPSEMLPTIIFLDEPELGLHPTGVGLIGGMIKALSSRCQMVVATQSPLLINAFDLDEVVVLEARRGATVASAVESHKYEDWLDEGYLPGDLWPKNLFGGLP